MYRLITAFALLLVLVTLGCGGGNGQTLGKSGGTTPPTSGNFPVGSPQVSTLAEGQTLGSMDIAVAAPVESTSPNALNLGVNEVTGSATASNTGDSVPRGTTKRVIIFGPGLTGDMQVLISGPADITVSNVIATKATDGTPGISFNIAVSSTAGLGARTVMLQSPGGDITTFTGGLEVVP